MSIGVLQSYFFLLLPFSDADAIYSLAYAEMRLIMARVLFEFDLELHPDSRDWAERQKEYILWEKLPLKIRLKRAVSREQDSNPKV